MRIRASVGALLIVVLVGLVAPQAASSQAAKPSFLMRVYFRDSAERDQLLATLPTPDHAVQPEGYLLAYGDTALLAQLRAAGHRAEIDQAATQAEQQPTASLFDAGYLSVDELYANLRAAVAAHPQVAELVDAGDSWCKTQGGCLLPNGTTIPGDDLWAMHITNRSLPGKKPVSFWIAAHHPREIHTTEIALRYIHWLLDHYGQDADITWMVDDLDIWVIPLGNPDAHRVVELGGASPLWQRKNLDTINSADWSVCGLNFLGNQSGVDLNRNHDFHWRGSLGGWSDLPCGETYAGALANGPASEPELQGYTALVGSLFADQRGPGDSDSAPNTIAGTFVSIHSGSRWMMIPYDWTNQASPNLADLEAVWKRVARWTPGWPACQTGQCYGITAGTASDWAYGVFGMAASLWEIGEFMPPYTQVDSYYWPFLRPMMLYTTRIARTPYLEARGPEIDIGTMPKVWPIGWPLPISATASDVLNGGNSIAAAELYVDSPPWAGGSPIGMIPADSAFDISTEQISASASLCSEPQAQRLLFIRAADTAGYHGPVYAAFSPACVTTPPVFLPLIAR